MEAILALAAAIAGAERSDDGGLLQPLRLPNRLRATGVGAAVAASRIGASISTFLLPVVTEAFGIRTAMTVLVLVLATGALACYRYAPETSRSALGGVGDTAQ
ncbi:hypothetical protein [Streptomyces sp. NPDC056982]|uniref:hypothetical protein n=1 Tax=Streptomyces sp. NPDC056982 TaxID=3345986 RepID=UPI00363CC3B5